MPLAKRLVTLLSAIALIAGASAPCAGATGVPEERMKCCANHCPMEDAGSHESSHAAAQPDHEACCVLSGRGDAEPSAKGHGSTVTLVRADGPLTLVREDPPADAWRTFAPAPIRTVPTHLLLSVLLV